MFIKVDLPEPEEPMTATNSPASTLSDTPSRARSATSPVWYTLLTSTKSMTASATCSAP
jgi:hypothetical protein